MWCIFPFSPGGKDDALQGSGPRNAVANAGSSETTRQTFASFVLVSPLRSLPPRHSLASGSVCLGPKGEEGARCEPASNSRPRGDGDRGVGVGPSIHLVCCFSLLHPACGCQPRGAQSTQSSEWRLRGWSNPKWSPSAMGQGRHQTHAATTKCFEIGAGRARRTSSFNSMLSLCSQPAGAPGISLALRASAASRGIEMAWSREKR